MTPELKSLSLTQAAQVKTDLLVVLLGPQAPEAQSPLGAWVHQAVKAGDLDLSKPGQSLPGYRVPGVAARRLVVLTTAGAVPGQWRSGLASALQSAKLNQATHASLILASGDPASIEMAVMVLFDASYVYTATKPSATASRLKKVQFGVPLSLIHI
mgnify:CR=1 FL=1